MPQGDRTGPRGRGPRTGRGLGNCPPQNDNRKEETNKGFGRGQGHGRRFR